LGKGQKKNLPPLEGCPIGALLQLGLYNFKLVGEEVGVEVPVGGNFYCKSVGIESDFPETLPWFQGSFGNNCQPSFPVELGIPLLPEFF